MRTEAAAADAKVVERQAEAASAAVAMRSEVQARTAKVAALKSRGASAEEVAEAQAVLATLERQLETADSMATAMKVRCTWKGRGGGVECGVDVVRAVHVMAVRSTGGTGHCGPYRPHRSRFPPASDRRTARLMSSSCAGKR